MEGAKYICMCNFCGGKINIGNNKPFETRTPHIVYNIYIRHELYINKYIDVENRFLFLLKELHCFLFLFFNLRLAERFLKMK